MKKLVTVAAGAVVKLGDVIMHNGKKLLVVGLTVGGAALCQAQTDATVIATRGYKDNRVSGQS